MTPPPGILKKMFNDPRWMALGGVILFVVVAILLLGQVLVPIVLSFVLAYFIEGGIAHLCRRRCSRNTAITLLFPLFLLVYLIGLLGPLQLALRQGVKFIANLPLLTERIKTLLAGLELPSPLEGIVPNEKAELIDKFGSAFYELGENLWSHTVSGLSGATSWLVYLFLIPLLVFFLLKDKESLIKGINRLLPNDRELVTKIWVEMEIRMASYIRGKMWEILIVGCLTWIAFRLLGFQYAAMTSLLAGLSVVIPYVGAFAVTIPIFFLGLVQWGWGWGLGGLMIAHVVIQFLDGNLLVPYLFSKAVKLSPTTILLSSLIFGSLWGVWGVFFAIPLATLTKTVASVYLEYRGA